MKISKEVATQEVAKWLDIKRIKSKKREELEDSIEFMIESFQEGLLRLEENGDLIQMLGFPLQNSEGETTLTELRYTPRLPMKKINQSLEGVKASDADGRIMGYVAAFTNQPRAVIGNIISDDFKLCQSIILFFL